LSQGTKHPKEKSLNRGAGETESQIEVWDATKKDIRETIDMLKTATKSLDEILVILRRLRTLAVTSARADCPAADRATIAREAEALIEEIDLIVKETKYLGAPLLAGRFEVWV
jgi:flagellin-like hook-associated protein FlgL